jgi:beta-aspartyl-peptidase (threonine type)
MKYLVIFFVLATIFACQTKSANISEISSASKPNYAIVIHGGAGTIERKNMSAEMEAEYKAALDSALSIGEVILSKGGKAIDAVEQTIRFLEDNPLFNAGKGAVFTHDKTNELDASIMDGKTQMAGAAGSVMTVRNPITLARAIMEKSEHVMMIGRGAEAFAAKNGLEIVDPSYFYTEHRYKGLIKAILEDSLKTQLSEDDGGNKKHGTVGCVALDLQGNIVAGTSTGGMTNKRYNRIGDAPIIGAGTYADNNTCGVSCTGHGEFFIRYTVARDVAAMMEYQKATLKDACYTIVQNKLVSKGGEGGLIAIDKHGNIEMSFNTPGMYRGYARKGQRYVGIYKED